MSKKIEDEHQIFKIGTQVEVASNEEGFINSLYKCTIIPPPPKSKKGEFHKRKKNFLWVEYETVVEEDDHSKHITEYVDVSFIRPLPPTCNRKKFERFDIVEANHRDGKWIGVILDVMDDGLKYLVGFANPYEEIGFERDELRAHLRWVAGDKWIRPPKKSPAVRSPEDKNETVVSYLLDSILTQVSVMEKTPSPAKRRKNATSNDAKGMQSSDLGNTVQALAAPPLLLGSSQLPSSEGNTNRALKLSGRRSNCSMVLSPNIGKNIQNDGNSSKKKKRVRPVCRVKSAVQRLINVLQIGETSGKSGVIHDSVTEQSPTSDPAGEELRESGVVHDNALEHIPTSDHAGDCQSKALIEYSNPECSILHNATHETNQSRSLPFTKRSNTWKVIESMEVFERFPQIPHFSPLKEHEENAREMLAICMMLKLAYEIERITARSDDLRSVNTIHESLHNFKEMESHGFSTAQFQVYLNKLLERIDAEKELQEDLAKVESEIKELQVEKNVAERKLCELVEQKKSLEEQMKSENSLKKLKEQQLRELESRRGTISDELLSVKLTKKTLSLEW